MNTADKITQDLGESMKAGTADVTGVLRLIKTSLKNEQIKLGHELSDDEALKVITKEAKQRRDSITAYETADRADLADIEKAELVIIERYLPKQMSEDELAKVVDDVLAETGATTKAQMGQVMGLVMKKTVGAADGGMVSRIVGSKLV